MNGALDRIAACGVLPVVELPDGADAVRLADALGSAGITCVEITLRTDAALDAITAIAAARPDVVVAAGSVHRVEQAEAATARGASVLVSAGFAGDVVTWAQDRGMEILPGVCTPSEIERGLAAGLATFKFFPAQAMGGVAYLAAIAGPFAGVRFVPTGGIDPDNLADYLRLENVIACGGSWLVRRNLLEEGDYAAIEGLARDARRIVDHVRSRLAPLVDARPSSSLPTSTGP